MPLLVTCSSFFSSSSFLSHVLDERVVLSDHHRHHLPLQRMLTLPENTHPHDLLPFARKFIDAAVVALLNCVISHPPESTVATLCGALLQKHLYTGVLVDTSFRSVLSVFLSSAFFVSFARNRREVSREPRSRADAQIRTPCRDETHFCILSISTDVLPTTFECSKDTHQFVSLVAV